MPTELGHAAGHETVHLAAAVVLIGGGAAFIALALARRVRPGAVTGRSWAPSAHGRPGEPDRTPPPLGDRPLLTILAGLAAGAAFLHLAAAPSHYVELGEVGAGFVAAGVGQAMLASAIRRGPSRLTLDLGIVSTLGLIALWAASRSVGLPLGPGGARLLEPIGLPDGAVVVFETLLAAGLVALRVGVVPPRRSGALRAIGSVAIVPVLGLVLVTASLATVAIVAGLEHGRPVDLHGPGAAPAHEGVAGT